MKKRRYIVILSILAAVLVLTALICTYCFSYKIIQGNYSDIENIEISVQTEDGNYKDVIITDSESIRFVYDTAVEGATGERETVQLYPSHSYSKDSVATITIVYKNSKQTVFIGYDDKLIYDLNPKFGSSERGFVYVNKPDVAETLKKYCMYMVGENYETE